MSNALTAILAERGQTHGDYEMQTYYSQMMKDIINEQKFTARRNGQQHPHMVYDALEMIVFKISRILAGKWDVEEHWVDIAGYAMLMQERIKKQYAASRPQPQPQPRPQPRPQPQPVMMDEEDARTPQHTERHVNYTVDQIQQMLLDMQKNPVQFMQDAQQKGQLPLTQQPTPPSRPQQVSHQQEQPAPRVTQEVPETKPDSTPSDEFQDDGSSLPAFVKDEPEEKAPSGLGKSLFGKKQS